MSTHKKPYTKKELAAVRRNLGKDGIDRVCEITGKTIFNIRKVLENPDRYQEPVFDAVAIALEEKQQRIQSQKNRINQAIAV